MLWIHHLVVEVFSWRLWESVHWAVVHCGLGDNIISGPINTKKGKDMNWGLMELSKQFWERRMVNLRKVRTIEKIVGECDRHQLQDGDSKQVSGIKIGW